MKKIISSMLVVLCIFGVVFAENQSLTTNILGLAFGSINATYEKPLKDNKAVAVSGSIFNLTIGDWSISALGIGGEYKIYPQRNVLKGFSYGPSLGISVVTAEYDEEKASNTFITLGFDIGYKWIMEGGFTIGVGAGVGYTVGSIEIAGEKAPYGGFGLSKLSLDIGYSW